MATERARERGEIKFGLIVALIVLAAAIFFAVKVVPVVYHTYAFKEEVQKIAEREIGRPTKEQTHVIRDRILAVAKDHGFEDDIRRSAARNQTDPVRVERSSSELRIRVSFVKPIDLAVTTWNWKVEREERHTDY